MAQHDDYGKLLLRRAAGVAFESYGPAVTVNYGVGRGAQIDGVVAGRIAVEIESRVSKQIRGAVLDLICHSCPKKLLVILPVHANNPQLTAEQCSSILARFVEKADFRVIVTKGSAHEAHLEEDEELVTQALQELGFRKAA